MNNQVLVAYDTLGPRWPIMNNQNFNVHYRDITVDIERVEFFRTLNNFKIYHTSLLEENDLFIYPIWTGFNTGAWFDQFPEDLFKDTGMTHETNDLVRFRNGYLFIDVSQEAPIVFNESNFAIDFLHMAFKRQHIPLNKVILQVGNMTGKLQYKDYCIKNNIPKEETMHISCVENFEWRASCFIHKYPEVISKKDHREYNPNSKTFLCLNRNYRWHRNNLFLLWSKFNLLDNSYYSMSDVCNYSKVPWKNGIDSVLTSQFNITDKDVDNFQSKLPLKLDNLRDAFDMAQLSGGLDHLYNSSLISVVTETNFDDNVIFNTEKIFKPILHQHPFIMVGPYKTLAHLKTMGYKTFSDFWDESYDDIVDPKKRLIKIVEICREINEWDEDRKSELFYASKIITRHNFNVLKSIYPYNMRKNFWHDFGDNMRVI